MRFFTFCFIVLSVNLFAQTEAFQTPFEKDNNVSADYFETIDFYKKLVLTSPQMELKEWGNTDAGFPLHTVVLSTDGDFDPSSLKAKGKLILFINNAIHPGEPCGVDASMMLFRDYLQKKEWQKWLDKVVLVAIPFYNIGGGLNRGSHSRANQDGPMHYGFRGNAKNLDLNRDFIKCDSKNARTFNQIYNYWQPDIFIDNHTSNGADYQYTLTMVVTQKDKLDPHLSEYMTEEMLPRLYRDMAKTDYEMTPYVYARNTPDDGIAAFIDLPRYSSGYAALHNSISFMSETHMLKPFKDRVKSTYTFMNVMIKTMNDDFEKIKEARRMAKENTMKKDSFALNWDLDFKQKETLLFKGYEAKKKPSAISGIDRLYYDRNEPFEKEIPFFNTYKTTLKVEKPAAYIIPQAYDEIIERLNWNGVEIQKLKEDAAIEVELYYIKDYKNREAYEGHFLHHSVEVEKVTRKQYYRKGDYVIFTNQKSNRYIVETLEPQAPDSYFAWNFFDGILMQKEYFSSYVFEDLALKILEENPDLKKELEAKKAEDEKFAKSARAQLDFIYKRSPHYEQTHNLYPVGRVMEITKLLVE